MIDTITLSNLPRGEVTADECPRETTCDFCDGPLSPGDWYVLIKSPAGRVYAAHTSCAGDKGWTIK